jgi:hypothetical protein
VIIYGHRASLPRFFSFRIPANGQPSRFRRDCGHSRMLALPIHGKKMPRPGQHAESCHPVGEDDMALRNLCARVSTPSTPLLTHPPTGVQTRPLATEFDYALTVPA